MFTYPTLNLDFTDISSEKQREWLDGFMLEMNEHNKQSFHSTHRYKIPLNDEFNMTQIFRVTPKQDVIKRPCTKQLGKFHYDVLDEKSYLKDKFTQIRFVSHTLTPSYHEVPLRLQEKPYVIKMHRVDIDAIKVKVAASHQPHQTQQEYEAALQTEYLQQLQALKESTQREYELTPDRLQMKAPIYIDNLALLYIRKMPDKTVNQTLTDVDDNMRKLKKPLPYKMMLFAQPNKPSSRCLQEQATLKPHC